MSWSTRLSPSDMRRDDPVRVGLVGGGFMARGITFQVERHMKGMTIAAIANRTHFSRSRGLPRRRG